MTARNNVADKFVLLFSADWFRPYWGLTGFVPKDGDGFQRDIRDLVGCMLDDMPCYWHIDFSEARLAKTRDGFLATLDQHHEQESNLALIRAMIAGEPVDHAMAEVSMAFWDAYERTIEDIRRADTARSEWDRHLIALTLDLPSLLQDFAIATLLRGGA